MVPAKKLRRSPVSPMSLLPAAPVSAGRKEEKWFPQKTCNDSRRSDLLAFLGNRSQREGTRKSGSLEKSAAVPLRTRLPWLPLGERARPGGMRKSGSFEKSIAPLVEPDSWTSV